MVTDTIVDSFSFTVGYSRLDAGKTAKNPSFNLADIQEIYAESLVKQSRLEAAVCCSSAWNSAERSVRLLAAGCGGVGE